MSFHVSVGLWRLSVRLARNFNTKLRQIIVKQEYLSFFIPCDCVHFVNTAQTGRGAGNEEVCKSDMRAFVRKAANRKESKMGFSLTFCYIFVA